LRAFQLGGERVLMQLESIGIVRFHDLKGHGAWS
jgi:hypothetical protein